MSAEPRPRLTKAEHAEDKADEGPAAAAAGLFEGLLRLARDVVELAAAELRLAALSGVTMLMFVIVAALLIVMAWGFIAAVAAYGLVAAGLSWPVAGLLIAAAHTVAAYLLLRGVVRLSRSLTFPELRRVIMRPEEPR